MFKGSKFKGKKACVLGAGKTGQAAAALLAKKGFEVLLSDAGEPKIKIKPPRGVALETGGHSAAALDCGFIVKSPGIKTNAAVLKKAAGKSVPVFSETEVALSYLPAGVKVFAVTGTNGKTTVTLLLAAVLKEYCKQEKKGRKTWTAGNVGTPLSAVAGKIKKGDYVALEMSSYQLEDSSYFSPDYAAILNFTPDHLEHHGSMKKYLEAKKKIFAGQNAKGIAVVNACDKNCLKFTEGVESKVLSFATEPVKKMRAHAFFDGDEMVFSSGERLRPPRLPGLHNVENAMAVALLTLSAGVPPAVIQKAFNSFKGVEHRIERALVYKGIECLNDSKSTNVDSTVTALKAVGKKKNIWLILGGTHKGSPYAPLLPLMGKYVKAALLIGRATPVLQKDLASFKQLYDVKNIDGAVRKAFEEAEKGDILLLSPACASFDQFDNFERRGEYFKEKCKALAKGK